MKTSESIKEIAGALSKAQAQMGGAKKDKANPFFKTNYADLASVLSAISSPFADNNLSFVQAAETHEGKVAVTTRIMHSSGEWIESITELPPTKNDAQGFGSSLTYAKRYGIQSLSGVPSEDDDGNAAVASRPAPKKAAKPQQTDDQVIGGWCNRMMGCKSLKELQDTWAKVPKKHQIACAASKEAAKNKLAPPPVANVNETSPGFEDGDVPL